MKTVNNFNLNIPSRSANESFARTAVSAFLTQLDPTLEEINDIKTAVSEAVTNCIVHAYREKIGKIYISCAINDNNVVKIKIKDNGIGLSEETFGYINNDGQNISSIEDNKREEFINLCDKSIVAQP